VYQNRGLDDGSLPYSRTEVTILASGQRHSEMNRKKPLRARNASGLPKGLTLMSAWTAY